MVSIFKQIAKIVNSTELTFFAFCSILSAAFSSATPRNISTRKRKMECLDIKFPLSILVCKKKHIFTILLLYDLNLRPSRTSNSISTVKSEFSTKYWEVLRASNLLDLLLHLAFSFRINWITTVSTQSFSHV